MEYIVNDGQVSFYPIKHKIPMGQKMDLSVPQSIQPGIVAELQAAGSNGKRALRFLKVVKHIQRSLPVFLFKQQIPDKPVQVLFRV